MSRHVGAKSQRFLDFNFSKAFLVSFLKILLSHSTTINQSKSMEDFKNFETMDPSKIQDLRNCPEKHPETPTDAILIIVSMIRKVC